MCNETVLAAVNVTKHIPALSFNVKVLMVFVVQVFSENWLHSTIVLI